MQVTTSEIVFQTKPMLQGQKVILRPFMPEDYSTMISLLEDPEIRRLTGSAHTDEEANEPTSPEEAEHIKQWYLSRNDQTNRLDLAIIEQATGQLVGEVVFNDYEPTTHNVNFHILIGAAGRGKGLGTEATALFLRYGFEVLHLHKVELEVYSFNPRAERVYRKCGFMLEGIKCESFLYNGEYIDTKLLGLLGRDYAQKHE
ncbi:Spermidine N(1)-acetyltransferase [compost metagenome]